ncbi:MAG: transglutaminaseTgpA domain-containing protein [Rhodoglobus sp.]
MTRSVSLTFVIVSSLLLWLGIALASIALWPIYRSFALVTLIVGSIVAGSVVAIIALWRRWSFVATALASFVMFLLIGVPLAVPSETQLFLLPTFRGLLDLVAGIALGWKQLLTISLPVGSYQALLVPALILVFGATVISLTLAWRGARPEFAVLPAIVVFLTAGAFGPSTATPLPIVAVALASISALTLVWFRWRRRRDSITAHELPADAGRAVRRKREYGFAGVRTTVSAIVIVAISSGIAVGVAQALPAPGERTVLRTSIVAPFDPRNYVSPLSGFRRYWQSGTANSVLFEVSGVQLGTRVRLATLDSYDGVVYAVGSDQVSSASGTFARVPYLLDQSALTGSPIAMTITVAGYSGVWLPTVDVSKTIDFAGPRASALRDAFYFNDNSGTAAVTTVLTRGDSYTVTGVMTKQPTTAQLSTLTPGVAEVPAGADSPSELTDKLDQYLRGATTPGERLVAMLTGLAADGYVSHGVGVDAPPSRSGHSAGRIAELFTAPRMIGDGEQYAVAASLMAKELGFPSRVVLGFVTSDQQIRGDDVVAWIEVNTAQYGWVTIDPNPPLREIPAEAPDDTAKVARPQTIVPPPEIESDTVHRQSNPDSEQALAPEVDPVLQAVLAVVSALGWSMLGLLILAAPILLIRVAKLRRRWVRKRAKSAVDRISGGFDEFEDALIDHGYRPPASATRSEIAAVLGTFAADDLAQRADRAIFSGTPPSTAEADSLWMAVTELSTELDRGRSRWAQFTAKISLRSLGGYSVTSLFER